MEEILAKIEQASGITIQEMASRCRKSELVAARLLFVIQAYPSHTPKEIGKLINLHRTTVINMKRGRHKPSHHYFEYKSAYEKL